MGVPSDCASDCAGTGASSGASAFVVTDAGADSGPSDCACGVLVIVLLECEVILLVVCLWLCWYWC